MNLNLQKFLNRHFLISFSQQTCKFLNYVCVCVRVCTCVHVCMHMRVCVCVCVCLVIYLFLRLWTSIFPWLALHSPWHGDLHTRLAQCFGDFDHKEGEKNKKKGMVNREKRKVSNIFFTWTCSLFSSHDLSSLQLIGLLFT